MLTDDLQRVAISTYKAMSVYVLIVASLHLQWLFEGLLDDVVVLHDRIRQAVFLQFVKASLEKACIGPY